MIKQSPSSSILSKSVLVLDTLGKAPGAVRYSDLVEQTGLSKSTTHRIVSILSSEGLVHFDKSTKTYRLGYRIMEWAAKVWQEFDLREVAQEEMNKLNKETGENINLAIREGNEIIYMNRVESFKPIRAVSTLGSRLSVHYTGLGKALTAFLPIEQQIEIAESIKYDTMTDNSVRNSKELLARLEETRRLGFALDDCEFRDEIRCIAAPIFDHQGITVGAISISSLVFRVSKETLLSWAPKLLTASKSISRKIGFVGGETLPLHSRVL